MEKLLFSVGTSFLRAFIVSFLVFAPGILSATNVDAALALSIAALTASIAAGIRVIQVFVPQISFASVVRQPIAAYADAFTRMFLATFLTSVAGLLETPDMSTWKSALLAAFTGALTAGVRALQGLVTPGEVPAPATGVTDPALTTTNPTP